MVRWCCENFPGKTSQPGRLTTLEVGQGPTVLALSPSGLFGHFSFRLSFLFSFFLSLGDGPI